MSSQHPLRSSDFRAIADDARKDEDNIAFLAALPLAEQAEWLTRLRWMRLADRLSENELLEPEEARFTRFLEDWDALIHGGIARGEHAAIFEEIRAAWLWPKREDGAIRCWSEFLAALRAYSRPDLDIVTLDEHDGVLARIGSLFGAFPYLRDDQREAAVRFGALDQAMNNLRDLEEDAAHGLSYFPRDVLARFGVTRASLFDGSAVRTDGFRAMMAHWLTQHVPSIRARAGAFVTARDLHPSLVQLREASLRRHARVSRALRDCDFDYFAFRNAYWQSRVITSAESRPPRG